MIGEKCLIKVLLNNKLSSVLLNELLDEPDPLRAQWGNQTDIPFIKYTVVNPCIGEGDDKYHLDVPFLITPDQTSNPIPGFNAIKHIAQATDDKILTKLFRTSLDQTDVNRIQAVVNLL